MSQTIILPGVLLGSFWIKNGIAQIGLRGAHRRLGFITLNLTTTWSLVGGWV